MSDFQKDETKLRAKAKKGTITDEEFFKEMKRLHKRATESIVIEDNKILLDTPYGYKQVSSIEDDVAYLYDGAVVQLTPEEVDEISGDTIEEEIDVAQVYEAGTSDGAKKGWDKRGRGRKAEDKPINPYPKGHSLHDDAEKNPNAYGKHQDSHIASYDMKNEDELEGTGDVEQPEDDPYDTRPVGADGQRLGKSAEDWEKEGYDVEIQRQNGIISVTKNGEDVWFSQSHEDNVEMFGEDWDNWDSQLILNYLDGSGAMDEVEDDTSGDSEDVGEQPDGNKQKELETNKEERSKGKAHNDLTLQKKWLKSPEDVEKATDEEIFALANGAQMDIAQGNAFTNMGMKGDGMMTGDDPEYYKEYMNGLRQSMSADLFGTNAERLALSGGGNEITNPLTKGGSKPMGLKDVWVSEKNYGFKSNDEGGLDLSLHDDMAGWMWNGDETDLIDYVNRVSGTNFKDEFIKKMNDSNVPFESVRDQMLRNLEENPDSLYAVSGDNRRWKFGEGTEIDMGIIDDEIDAIAPDLTPEQRQQVKDTVDEFAEGGSYEGFMESEHGGQLKDLVEGAIQNSNSFEDLFFQFGDWEKGLGYSKAEMEMYYNDELTRDAIYNAVDSVKNKKDVAESKATEWTPSQGHDWQPPTQEDYKDLPKPTKNQKMAGSHDEPDFSNMKQDGRNRDNDGKFSKERKPKDGEEGYADRKSDLNKAWKSWKRTIEDRKKQARNNELNHYNDWIEFAKDNGATDEEADDTWDEMEWDLVHWKEFGESKAREARIHQQTDVKKKWLERCETCGDIRSSHTAGIDHSFKVDATGVEFVDKGNVFENSILIKSGLQPKRYSKEYISQQIQYEAQKWWHDNYSKKHGRKDFREMTIIEKKKVFLAYLESVVGYGAKLPNYKPTKKGKSYDEDVISIYETVKGNANEVRKVLMEAKQVRFNNPDPKFWWNADEMRTGMVLNEFKRSGLEWYSVNSAGQLYDVLKDEAELVASENKPLKEMSNDELLSAREYVYGTYKNLGYMKQIEAEIKDRGIGNPNFKKDWKDEETRDDKSVENDNKSEKDLEKVTSANKVEEVPSFKDEIDKSLELEADEMHEDIQEAKPNTLIRYANPRKLPNGKTVMDRVRTSHPQVLERKANEDKNCQHPDCVGARAEDLLFNNFVVPRGGGMKCNHCGKYWSKEPENTFTSAQTLDQPIVQDLLHHLRTHGITESKADEWWGEDYSVVKFMNEVAEDLFGKKYEELTQNEKDQVNMSMTSIDDPDLARVDKLRFANPELDSAMTDPNMEFRLSSTRDEDHYINDYESLATEDVKDEDWFKEYQRNVDSDKAKISDLWKKDEKANEKEDIDLTCGMCNGTGEIYMDTIVTCHECNGTGKITFEQLPQWKKEQYASEGGFGSGKRGHSSWMKDIEFGGNYKKCPLCNINTNFTNGKCEICGNSFAGEKKKANEMSDDEWMNKIEQLANKTGVKTIAVQNFLISVDSNGSVGNALANLESDTRMYKWDARTVNAIQKGIMIYFDKVKNDSSQTFEDKYPNTLW